MTKSGKIGIIILAILLIAGAVFLYLNYFSPEKTALRQKFGKYKILASRETAFGKRFDLEAPFELKLCSADGFEGVKIDTLKQIVYLDENNKIAPIQKEDAEGKVLAAVKGEIIKTEFKEAYIVRRLPDILFNCDIGPVWVATVKLTEPFVSDGKTITHQEIVINEFSNPIYQKDFYTETITVKDFADPQKEITQEIFVPATGKFMSL